MSEEILTYARSRNVTRIIVGKPTHARWKDKAVRIAARRDRAGQRRYRCVRHQRRFSGAASHAERRRVTRTWRKREWAWSVLSVGAATGAAALMQPYFEQVDLVMVYLVGVMFIASRTSTWPALFAAFLSVASYDFFFVPPFLRSPCAMSGILLSFAVMFLVSHRHQQAHAPGAAQRSRRACANAVRRRCTS